jgi:peroxiredoxin
MEGTSSVVVAVLLALILVSVWAVLYVLFQVIKQQGRLLLRLDTLENNLGVGSQGMMQAEPQGLEVGTAFDSFNLPDLKGQQVALEDFRGKRVLLVNWSPQCGYCDLIAPDLARLQPDLKQHNVQLVLAAHGDAETNRKLAEEHGLDCPILLQKDSSLEAFQSLGTPVAYLLDEDGKVAQPIAIGAEQVPALAQKTATDGTADEAKGKKLASERPLSESRIVRDGLKAGRISACLMFMAAPSH